MVMSQPTENMVLKSLKWSVVSSKRDSDGISLLGIDGDNLKFSQLTLGNINKQIMKAEGPDVTIIQ